MCMLSVSKVIYHKFSHGAAFYTLNGKNVNVILESYLMPRETALCEHSDKGASSLLHLYYLGVLPIYICMCK